MKTIEERAYEFACKNDKPSSFFCDLEKGYKVGATEQKVIDDDHLRKATKMLIDKACAAHCKLCDYYLCCPYEYDVCWERSEIKRAMED